MRARFLVLAGLRAASPCFDVVLLDSFGDGWQGAAVVVTRAKDALSPPLLVGQLASGYSETVELCLADGCYDVAVGEDLYASEVSVVVEPEVSTLGVVVGARAVLVDAVCADLAGIGVDSGICVVAVAVVGDVVEGSFAGQGGGTVAEAVVVAVEEPGRGISGVVVDEGVAVVVEGVAELRYDRTGRRISSIISG